MTIPLFNNKTGLAIFKKKKTTGPDIIKIKRLANKDNWPFI